jgi:hypothetical protein
VPSTPPGAPSKKKGTGTCRIWDMCWSLLALMRFTPFSYFWTIWNVKPSASPSFFWLIPSIIRRMRTRLPTCRSTGLVLLVEDAVFTETASHGSDHRAVPRHCDDSTDPWRVAISRVMAARIRTDGFIDPCTPTLAAKPPVVPDWVLGVDRPLQ